MLVFLDIDFITKKQEEAEEILSRFELVSLKKQHPLSFVLVHWIFVSDAAAGFIKEKRNRKVSWRPRKQTILYCTKNVDELLRKNPSIHNKVNADPFDKCCNKTMPHYCSKS